MQTLKNKFALGLVGLLPANAEDCFIIGLLDKVKPEDLPIISISAGLFEWSGEPEYPVLVREGISTFSRDFKQVLYLEIYHTDEDKLEELLSLVTGIFIMDTDIIKNQASGREYSSGVYKTGVIYIGINIDHADSNIEELYINYRLTINVTGRFTVTKTITEGFETIKEVIVKDEDGNTITTVKE